MKNFKKYLSNETYDSTLDTQNHINRLRELLSMASDTLIQRGIDHDKSKLDKIEKPLFDIETPLLKSLTYGTDEYKDSLKRLGIALDNHYKNNSHHPEHYENGIDDMDLFDIIEMFFDWKAAGERHENGNIYKSIDVNKKRFKMSDQLVNIYTNTAKKLGW